MKGTSKLAILAAVIFLLCGNLVAQVGGRFQDQIDAFIQADLVHPPPKGAILFIGSSIFRQWKHLDSQMSPMPVFNRAFGGSRTNEIFYYSDKIVFPYQPKIIVYYCGSNDVNANEPAEAIFARIREFSERVKMQLPKTTIYFASIHKAPQKKDKWNVVDAVNLLLKNYCEKTKSREYIEMNPILFDKDGGPRLELFLADKLHFKESAYVEFAALIKPILEKAWKKEQKQFCKLNGKSALGCASS